MLRNVWNSLLLLVTLAFLFPSCSAHRKTDRSYTTRKSGEMRSSSKSHVSTLRKDIRRYARRYKGSRYKYAGADPKGFDCSGFTSYVLKKFDVKVSRSSKVQATEGRKISLRRARPGDLLFFSKSGRGKPSHVALVIDNRSDGLIVVHSTTSRGVIEENISQSTYWKPKLLFARDVIDP